MNPSYTAYMMQNKILYLGVLIALVAVGVVAYAMGALAPSAPSGQTQITAATTTFAQSGKQMSIDSYVTQNISTLSPVKASLGGTFYVTEIQAIDGKGLVHYEDGHNAYIADFTYTPQGNGQFVVNSFIVR